MRDENNQGRKHNYKKKFTEGIRQEKEDVKENIENAKKSKVAVSIFKFLILITIVVAIPVYIAVCKWDLIQSFGSLDEVVDFLKGYKAESILVYVGMQVLQIVVSIIPGQAFQFAAGILYGFLLGLLLSIIGAVIGTTITFYLAKILGQDALHLFFTEEKFNYFVERLNSKKAYTLVLLIYLIPGLPKDIMSYAAGVSSMNFKAFLAISVVGRLPGMAGSLLVGALYFKGHYVAMWIVAAAAVIAFFLCIIKRKKIFEYMDRFYEKITE